MGKSFSTSFPETVNVKHPADSRPLTLKDLGLEETPEKKHAKEAAFWWVCEVRKKRGLFPFEKRGLMSWLDDFPGSISWTPTYSWLLYTAQLHDALDMPKYQVPARGFPHQYFQAVGDYLKPFLGEMRNLIPPEGDFSGEPKKEYQWVMRVEKEVVRLYEARP